MCVYRNSYVATSTILCRDSVSVQLLQIGVVAQFICCDIIFVGSCYKNVSCIVTISVATRKVYRDRVLSPLNLISCCSFILMSRHSLLVLSMFSVTTKFYVATRLFVFSSSLCRDPVCYVATRPLLLMLESLSRHRKVYRDLVYHCSAYLCVMTLRSLLQHRNISSALKYVATLHSFIVTRSVH